MNIRLYQPNRKIYLRKSLIKLKTHVGKLFSTINVYCFLLGLTSLILGYLFYIIFRQHDPLSIGFINETLTYNNLEILPTVLQESLPSLIHVISISLMHISLLNFNQKNINRVVIFWVLINIIYELLQSQILFNHQMMSGTSDPMDILFSILGGGFILFFSHIIIEIFDYNHSQKPSRIQVVRTPLSKRQQNMAFSSVILLGIGIMLGCEHPTDATPIYLSYSDLRSELIIDNTRPLKRSGEIYLTKSYLLINERNVGLHVYNNSDPTNPVFQKFINIPGNTDMAIKDEYLFANSYIDLLIIDLSDIENIHVAKRIENTFPYNPHQNIPSYIDLIDLDITQGVVVDYKIIEE